MLHQFILIFCYILIFGVLYLQNLHYINYVIYNKY